MTLLGARIPMRHSPFHINVRRPFIVAARLRLGLPVDEPPTRPRLPVGYMPIPNGPNGAVRFVPIR